MSARAHTITVLAMIVMTVDRVQHRYAEPRSSGDRQRHRSDPGASLG